MSARKRRWIRRGIITLLVILVFEYIPGRYTIEDAQDDYELDSWEGIALLAMESIDLKGRLYFADRTRHRISRNAEIVVPAGATLTVDAWAQPFVANEEVILRADRGELRSDKPLTFIYRGVTVARARVLRTRENDPDHRLQAIGQYRVISALATAFRYHRQKKVRRDYQEPTRAELDLSLRIRPSHDLLLPKDLTLRTGSEPGFLRLREVKLDQGRWTNGFLDMSASLASPEEALNAQLGALIPNEFELTDSMSVTLKRVHDLRFRENRIDLRVDGEFRLSDAFKPDFKSDLGFDVLLPQEIALNDAEAGIALATVRDLDINRVNPLMDKMLRGVVRSRKEDLSEHIHLGEEFPEIAEWPVFLFLNRFVLDAGSDGGPRLTLEAEVR